MSEPYKPIACGVHDQLELAIMHAERLALVWTDADGAQQQGILEPVDIQVSESVEYLVFRSGDRLRLDRIKSFEVVR